MNVTPSNPNTWALPGSMTRPNQGQVLLPPYIAKPQQIARLSDWTNLQGGLEQPLVVLPRQVPSVVTNPLETV